MSFIYPDNFRDGALAIAPAYLNGPVGERFLYGCIGLPLDYLQEKMRQGGLARMPTRCDPSLLPIIGSDRLIQRGITETEDSYRRRLQIAFESWQIAGSARSVLTQALGVLLSYTPEARTVSTRFAFMSALLPFYLEKVFGVAVTAATNASPISISTAAAHGYATGNSVRVSGVLGNTAANGTWTVTVVSSTVFTLNTSSGNGGYTSGGRTIFEADVPAASYIPTRLGSEWYTYAAGASTTGAPVHYRGFQSTTGDWDWDSLSTAAGSYLSADCYVVLYAVAPNTFLTPGPKWGSGRKWGAGMAWGVSQSANVGLTIRTVVGAWKQAGASARTIIVSFDASLFDPAHVPGGGVNPDGRFGRWSKIVAGQYVPSRFANARYAQGVV